jgi:hypothetical protein
MGWDETQFINKGVTALDLIDKECEEYLLNNNAKTVYLQ